MAKQVYALDAELKEAVQLWVRQMGNSFQPRPKRGRRQRRFEGTSTADEDEIRYVAIITAGSVPAGTPSEPGSSATTLTPPTFTIKQISGEAGTGAGGLPGIDGEYIDPDPAFPASTHHVLLNPFPYAGHAGVYAVDLCEDLAVPEGEFVSLMWRIAGFDLTGVEAWDLPTFQVFVHETGQPPSWGDASLFEGPEGPQGPQGDPGVGDTVAEGYAIDIAGAGTVTIHNDPTEWTGFAGQFQFFHHLAAAAARTDPAWNTVADYDAAKNQMWWHKSGAFFFETTTDYGGSATEPQFLLNWGAGNGGEWQWKSATGYDNTDSTQLLGHINGTWQWKSIAEWLNLLAGYAAGSDQVIGHTGGGASEWKTLTSKVINNPTDIDLVLASTTLTSQLDYTPVTVKLWPAASDGAAANFNEAVTVDDCA